MIDLPTLQNQFNSEMKDLGNRIDLLIEETRKARIELLTP